MTDPFLTPQSVLDAYADGTRRLDRALLAACFHPHAVMAGWLGDQIMAGGVELFLNDIAAMHAAGVDHSAIRMVLEPPLVCGATATGRVLTQGFGGRFDFDDRFHLLCDESGHWSITAKLFTTR